MQCVQAEVAEVVVDGLLEEVGRGVHDPGAVVPAACADFGDEGEVVGVGMERLLDELVGDVGAVEVAGVDVVDAAGDGFAENGERRVRVLGGTEDVRAGELHGAVAHAVHGKGGAGEGEGAAEGRWWGHALRLL